MCEYDFFLLAVYNVSVIKLFVSSFWYWHDLYLIKILKQNYILNGNTSVLHSKAQAWIQATCIDSFTLYTLDSGSWKSITSIKRCHRLQLPPLKCMQQHKRVVLVRSWPNYNSKTILLQYNLLSTFTPSACDVHNSSKRHRLYNYLTKMQ